MVREECGRQRSWHDHETWSGSGHEVRSVPAVQRSEKTVHAAAKIPNQAWLTEADSAEFHTWSQVITGFPTKLIRGKESGNDRWNGKSDCEIDRSRCKRAAPEKSSRRLFRGQFACEQKREQGKGWQRVMRQLRLDEREDDEDDRRPGKKVVIDLVPPLPKLLRQPRSEEHTSELPV